MPAGPLVERVQVTPEMCEEWLKYALPPLFRAPKVEGAFSVQLAGCQIPLANPEAGDVAGQMTIHSIDVEPGPLMQELAIVLGRPTAARLAQESKVDFKIVGGASITAAWSCSFPRSRSAPMAQSASIKPWQSWPRWACRRCGSARTPWGML